MAINFGKYLVSLYTPLYFSEITTKFDYSLCSYQFFVSSKLQKSTFRPLTRRHGNHFTFLKFDMQFTGTLVMSLNPRTWPGA